MNTMRHIYLAITLLTVLLSGTAEARNDSGAIGGFNLSIGSATASGKETTLSNSTAYGGGLLIGYMVNRNFSLEVSYTSVGGPRWDVVSVTDSSMTADALLFVHTSDISSNALLFQFGTGMLTTAANLPGQPASRSNVGGRIGVGYEFNHSQQAAFRFTFSIYDTGYNQVRFLSAGPVWKF